MYRFVYPYKIHFIFLPKQSDKDLILYKTFICNHNSLYLFGKRYIHQEKKDNKIFLYFDNIYTPTNIKKYIKNTFFITNKIFKTNEDLITIYKNNIFCTKDFILD
jgi:hypothetical protein